MKVVLRSIVLGLAVLAISCGKRTGKEGEAARPPVPSGPPISSEPLLPAATAPEGEPLFSQLKAEATGIDFVHVWNPPAEHAAQLRGAFSGSGVCLGDYDGDGLLDIFLTRQSDQGRLYRNRGDFRFEDVTASAGILLEGGPMWSTGASFADVDNDGNLDLSVCGFDSPNRLYMNNGDGTFSERSREMGLDFKGAGLMMAFSDYDLDGDLDVYLLTNRILSDEFDVVPASAYRRGPDGTYTIDERYREYADVIQKPDGTLKRINAAQYDHLYRNDGSGAGGQLRFTDVSGEAGISGNHYGLSAVWWDYNADGYPDLYVANDFFGPDKLYRNNGPGASPTFTDVVAEAMPYTPWFSMGADTGDLNNDGRPDLVATDMAGSNHYRDKLGMGNMSGPDSDGWFLNFPDPPQYMRNAVFVNTGAGRFFELAFQSGMASTDWTWTPAIADLDNDGREDVFVSNGMSRDWLNADLQAEAATHYIKGDVRASLAAADKFWAGQPTLAQSNRAFQNTGRARFDDVGEAWGLAHEGVGYGAASGDLDGDGDLDLVVNHFEEPVHVYRNNSAPDRNRLALRLVGTQSNRSGVGARVAIETEGDPSLQTRTLTLSRGFMSAGSPVVHFGLGSQPAVRRLEVRWPSGTVQSFEDLEANQLYTIVEQGKGRAGEAEKSPLFERSELLRGIAVNEAEFDDFERQPLLPNQHSRLGPGMAWADVNGDGHEDFFVGRGRGLAGYVYDNQGPGSGPAGRFVVETLEPFDADAASEDMGVLFFDADGDSDLDLYVVSGGVECEPGAAVLRDRLYLNVSEPGGRSAFEKAPPGALPDLRDSGGAVAVADFDRDGDLDLFVGTRIIPGRYPEGPESRLLENRTELVDGVRTVRFVEVAAERAPALKSAGLVTAAVWSDADGDGWVDLLVATEWGPVRYYRNEGGRLVERTAESGLAERHGWYNSIAAGDVDNDGDMDYAVGNFGLNTKYGSPTASKPQLLYYGDFDGTGEPHIVEAKYEIQPDGTKRCYPVRGLGCSSDAMPWVREKLPTFHEFAIRELTEIYPQQRLESATPFEVNSLHTGVLRNDGTGKFSFEPLPDLAQVAPVHGLTFCDADGDGHADLYLLQNFFSPQRETGRMSGGVSVLLRGQGDGSFVPLWPDESGLVVGGDARSLAVTDLNGDGWEDFVVAVNEGEMLAFENRPAAGAGARPVAVRLGGKPGNPTAVGAKITLRYEDGSSRAAEIHAGTGYLSQGRGSASIQFGLPNAGGGVAEILVRWPDGTTTTVREPDPASTVSIAWP